MAAISNPLHVAVRLVSAAGAPVCAFLTLAGLRELIRLSWGGAQLWIALVAACAAGGCVALMCLARFSLATGPTPWRPLEAYLDLIALRRLHAATWLSAAALMVLPGVWIWNGDPGFGQLWRTLGLGALRSGDFRDSLDPWPPRINLPGPRAVRFSCA